MILLKRLETGIMTTKVQSRIESGFTLVEVLVVLVIIATFIGFVAISASSYRQEEDKLDNIAKHLENKFKLAHLDAITKQQLFRFTISQDYMGFQRFVEDKNISSNHQWQWIESDRLLRRKLMPEGVQLQITSRSENEIWFYPNGEISQYELTLKKLNQQVILSHQRS